MIIVVLSSSNVISAKLFMQLVPIEGPHYILTVVDNHGTSWESDDSSVSSILSDAARFEFFNAPTFLFALSHLKCCSRLFAFMRLLQTGTLTRTMAKHCTSSRFLTSDPSDGLIAVSGMF